MGRHRLCAIRTTHFDMIETPPTRTLIIKSLNTLVSPAYSLARVRPRTHIWLTHIAFVKQCNYCNISNTNEYQRRQNLYREHCCTPTIARWTSLHRATVVNERADAIFDQITALLLLLYVFFFSFCIWPVLSSQHSNAVWRGNTSSQLIFMTTTA